MATKYLILVNNAPITTKRGDLIFEVVDNGEVKYMARNSNTDYSDLVAETFEKVMARDADNELNEVVGNVTDNSISVNDNFRLKSVSTPVYNLQKQLSMAESGHMRIPGVNFDLTGVWESQRLKFLTGEFFKYVHVVPYLENTMNASLNRPSNPSLAARRGDQRVMNLVHAKINALYNPYDTFKFLKNTELFKKAYDSDYSEPPMNLDRPTVFQTIVVKESTEVIMGTSSDILSLCRVDHKLQTSTMNLHRLMAGICLKLIGAGDSVEVSSESLYFPIGRRFYEVYDVAEGSRIVGRYFNPGDANKRADEDDLLVRTVDTDENYINSAFPGVTNLSLLDSIRGADFV